MRDTLWTHSQRPALDLRQTLQDYYQLTKPRIIPLLLIETAAGMWLAAQGGVDLGLMAATLLGGTLAAASAQTINCIYDRDIDKLMERTSHRPIPSGRVRPYQAFGFAVALAVLSFGLLWSTSNLWSAGLAMAGIALYVGVYTHWLKRSSVQNIVIGGAAGAVPALVGWAAVTGGLAWPAWVLFAIVFVWTPPHFWSLALLIQDDYAKVGIPMLPVVAGNVVTVRQIFAYSLVLVPLTLMLILPLQQVGVVYGASALLLGATFIAKAWDLLHSPDNRDKARSLFKYSIAYMMLLCAAIGVDRLPFSQAATQYLAQSVQQLFIG
ncbi:MAG: heme o synthase [Cyanobacteria bacterium P01_D01_bin.123]